MTTRDMGTLLAEAMHAESALAPVTDSQAAVVRLERAMRDNRRRRGALLLASAAAAAALLAAAGAGVLTSGEDRSAPPTVSPGPELPPPGHRVVFDSADGEIVVVDDRGGRARPVLDGDGARFSPDGRRVVFADSTGTPSVATVGEWRGQPLDDRPLEAGYEREGLVWSPDGTQVAYVEMLDSDVPEGGDLFLVDVATGKAELVRHFGGPYVTVLDWSPDGASLVMGFDRSGEGGRMVVDRFDLATRDLTPLLRGWGETLGVRYSPDGTQIAFYSDSRLCICVASPDGSDVRAVLTFSSDIIVDSARLAWSPDGSQIAWTERFGGRVSLLDVDTGRSRELTLGGGRAPQIDWDRP